MGAAAVPMALLGVGMGMNMFGQMYAARQQNQVQQQMIESQRVRDENKAKRMAMSQEIERIKKSRQVLDANIKKSLSSGFTMGGTTGDIMDSNMDLVDEDLAMIKANKEMAINDINRSAQNAKGAARFESKMNQFNAVTNAVSGSLMNIGGML